MLAPLSNLATYHVVDHHWPEAAEYLRRATKLIIGRLRRTADVVGKPLVGQATSEVPKASSQFSALVRVLHRLDTGMPEQERSLASETFVAAQWAQSSEAAVSLAQMAARGAKGDLALAAWSASGRTWSANGKTLDKTADRGSVGAQTNAIPPVREHFRRRLAAIDARIGESMARSRINSRTMRPSPIRSRWVSSSCNHSCELTKLLSFSSTRRNGSRRQRRPFSGS